MEESLRLLAEYGIAIVFANVLLEQLGAPLPAIPTMIIAGALAGAGHFPPLAVFGAAMAAAVLADTVWYLAGRRLGRRVLSALCRISLSPDSCVRQTETFFDRWGVGSLVVAKFVPGLSTVAPPLAGAMRLGVWPFQLFNGIGAALWAGSSVLVGWLLAEQIERVLDALARMGGIAAAAAGVLLVGYVLFKAWERWRFLRELRAARITVDELYALMETGAPLVVLDVLSETARRLDARRIPTAWPVDPSAPDPHLEGVPRDREIVLYCS